MAISLSNLATSEECQYKNEYYDRRWYKFTCDEPIRDTGSKLCIFHDINYLKGDNYEKHKEVVKRFQKKLSEYSSNNMPLEFRGYCLPDILFQNKQFTEALYFNYAMFYGVAIFSRATFSKEAYFISARFFNEAEFRGAIFSAPAHFSAAKFCALADFPETQFSSLAHLHYLHQNKITLKIREKCWRYLGRWS